MEAILDPNGAQTGHIELYGAQTGHIELYGALTGHVRPYGALTGHVRPYGAIWPCMALGYTSLLLPCCATRRQQCRTDVSTRLTDGV